MTTIDANELASRYVAIWNQPDAELRRKAIQGLWADDGIHVLQPPEGIRQIATRLGFPFPTLEARGYDALEARVTRAYEDFVASGKFTFKPRHNADRLGDVVKFGWEMVPTGGHEVAGAGLDILILDEDGRIKADCQFIE
jgi:hypothetical protein